MENLEKRVSRLEYMLNVEQENKVTAKEVLEKSQEQVKHKKDIEENLGFQWFSRIGILALVIGVGFFLKYAFDNNLIGYGARIFMGVSTGILMIIGGELIAKREKYQIWAKRIVAGGFAITYFSVYAAYHFQTYRDALGISLSMDIILLSIVVAGGILLALKDDSQTFAGSAFILGFVTAYLGNEVGNLTLIYGLLLTLALVGVSIYKQWNFLGIGGVVATYTLYFSWASDNADMFWPSTIFLSCYYIAYNVQSLFNKEKDESGIVMVILNSLLFYLFYYSTVDAFYPDFVGLFTWIMAVLSFVLYFIARNINEGVLKFNYLALAIFFLTFAIPIELKDQWIAISWSLEALILIIIGINLDVKLIRYSAYIVMLLAACKAFFTDVDGLAGYLRTISLIGTALAAYASGTYLEIKLKGLALAEKERWLTFAYNIAATILVATFLAIELKDFWISVSWAIFALALTVTGFVIKSKSIRLVGILLFSLTILKVFIYDSQELSTIYRTVSFIVLGVILLLVSFGYNRYKDRLKEIL